MNVIQSLVSLLTGKQKPAPNEIPDGYCPNCWGRNEYGGQFYEAVKNDKVDANSNSAVVGWVQDYANKHLTDIELQKDGDNLVCSKCKLTYRAVE